MRWPYSQRVSPGTAWAVVGVGVALLGIVTTIFATVHGSQPDYRWWWPTEWMWPPVAVTAAGLVALAVPLRRGNATREAQAGREQSAVHNETSGRAGNVVQAGQVHGNIYQGPVHMAPKVSPEPSRHRETRERIGIGEGLAGWRGPFQRAWNELWGRLVSGPEGTPRLISILDPSSQVYSVGPGVVQHFDSLYSEFGWVMCARPGQRVVVVSGEIWHELHAVGAAALTEHPLDALGFPVPSATATVCIDDSALEVDLAGGVWGPGRLLRESAEAPWRWEPKPAFDIDRTRDADVWTRDVGMRLRLRLVATLPWQVPGDLEITPRRRAAVEGQLAQCELVRYVENLSRRRGAELPTSAWTAVPHSNTSDRLGYECTVCAPDGRTIVTVEALLHLPSANSSSVVTCVQVSVHDLGIWREALETGLGAEVRLSTAEIAEFYAIAATTATTLLPSALGDQLRALYFSPPKIQLILATDKEDHTKPAPLLEQYIALESLGQNGRGPTDRLEVAITAAPLSDPASSAQLTRDALVFAARKFGFSAATAESFE